VFRGASIAGQHGEKVDRHRSLADLSMVGTVMPTRPEQRADFS